jgi:hypothetical protein
MENASVVYLNVSAERVNMPRDERAVIWVRAAIEKNMLRIPPLPPVWITGKGESLAVLPQAIVGQPEAPTVFVRRRVEQPANLIDLRRFLEMRCRVKQERKRVAPREVFRPLKLATGGLRPDCLAGAGGLEPPNGGWKKTL